MNINEKIEYLQDNHFGVWIETRSKCKDRISDQQSMFCVCGRLATGLHEDCCRKFNSKVNRETVKELSHLIKKVEEKV